MRRSLSSSLTRLLPRLGAAAGLGLMLTVSAADAQPTRVRITVTNLAPMNGTALTPMWLGVHDGTFRVFTPGEAVSAGLESLAEDGATGGLASEFTAAGFSRHTTLFGPDGVFLPGGSASTMLLLDPTNSMHRYLSYASMLLPSNDAFIGTSNPLARDLTLGTGMFQNFSFTVAGSQVWDAGTEVNDELESSTAFFGQSAPNTGTDENGVAMLHEGFTPGGRILSEPRFMNADFTADGYNVARFDIEVVPEPASVLLLLSGVAMLGVMVRRRRGDVA